MSFTLGVYELFTYLIPGAVTLFITSEILKIIEVDISSIKLDNFGHVIFLALISFVLGVLIKFVAHKFWKLINKNYHPESMALKKVQDVYPEIDFNIRANQWPILLAHARRSNLTLADQFERMKAIFEMLDSLSVVLVLLATIEIFQFFFYDYMLIFLGFGISCIVLSFLAHKQARRFDYWFYLNLFEFAASCQLEISQLVSLKKKRTKNDRSSAA